MGGLLYVPVVGVVEAVQVLPPLEHRWLVRGSIKKSQRQEAPTLLAPHRSKLPVLSPFGFVALLSVLESLSPHALQREK